VGARFVRGGSHRIRCMDDGIWREHMFWGRKIRYIFSKKFISLSVVK
jgi:hypothetical protein